MSDSTTLVRSLLFHIASEVLWPETPASAEPLLTAEVSETLADMLPPAPPAARPAGPPQ